MRFVFMFLLVFASAAPAQAAKEVESRDAVPVFEMDEYVVTGTSVEDQVRNIPRNVTVITREEIENSSAGSLAELLGREAGLGLYNTSGVPGRSVVDVRGQGEHAATNVLVLVNGHRINSVDMSGPRLSSILLSNVQRIEILRGPGSVLYGDNAVGGVINVITAMDRLEDGFSGYLGAEYGSWETQKIQAGVGGMEGIFTMDAGFVYTDSEGYRDNGDFQTKNGRLRFGLEPTDRFYANLDIAVHEDEYGMPGGVALSDVDDRDKRTETASPRDNGSITEQNIQLETGFDIDSAGVVEFAVGFRNRENPYVYYDYDPADKWGYEGFSSEITERTTTFGMNWSNEVALFGRVHFVRIGIDGFRSDYSTESEYLYNWGSVADFSDGNVLDTALFATTGLSLADSLTLNLGIRSTGHDVDKDSGIDKKWTKTVYDAGLVYSFGDIGSVYTSVATGFRTPTVDEMNRATDDIKPQSTLNYELGTHLKPLGNLGIDLALFRMETEDEISYDSINNLNDNYDEKTVRHGLEVGIRYLPVDAVTLWANYAWIDARFEDSEDRIPMVAEHEVSAGADWRVVEQVLLSVSGRYVSSKHDGADITNDQYEKLDSYAVVDTKMTWEVVENMKLYCGVNNLFDELYATTAYFGSYYVMPERNYYAGMEWSF